MTLRKGVTKHRTKILILDRIVQTLSLKFIQNNSFETEQMTKEIKFSLLFPPMATNYVETLEVDK